MLQISGNLNLRTSRDDDKIFHTNNFQITDAHLEPDQIQPKKSKTKKRPPTATLKDGVPRFMQPTNFSKAKDNAKKRAQMKNQITSPRFMKMSGYGPPQSAQTVKLAKKDKRPCEQIKSVEMFSLASPEVGE